MPVKCINQDVCQDCPHLELNINKLSINAEDGYMATINEIYCAHYVICTRLLKYLINRKDDLKYIGRDGD